MEKKLSNPKGRGREGNPSKERLGHVFPWEENLRGKSRKGNFKLPETQFIQQPDIRDSGKRLTPDYEPDVREGNIKFGNPDTFGKY